MKKVEREYIVGVKVIVFEGDVGKLEMRRNSHNESMEREVISLQGRRG